MTGCREHFHCPLFSFFFPKFMTVQHSIVWLSHNLFTWFLQVGNWGASCHLLGWSMSCVNLTGQRASKYEVYHSSGCVWMRLTYAWCSWLSPPPTLWVGLIQSVEGPNQIQKRKEFSPQPVCLWTRASVLSLDNSERNLHRGLSWVFCSQLL